MHHTIAVLPLRPGSGITQAEAELITDRLNAELFRTGKITLLERDRINEILKEQGLQSSGSCSDEACLVQMGQVLGVQEIVSGSIGQLGKLTMVNLRMIDVATGQVLRVVSQDIMGKIEEVIGYLPGIAREMVGLERGAPPPAPAARVKPPAPAPPPPAPAPQELRPAKNTAMIVVTSTPESAEVFLDGVRMGLTPYLNNKLTPREYMVSVRKADHESYETGIDPGKEETEEINATLVRKFGRLEISSTPAGAAVTINNKPAGATPFANDRVAPATYQLQLALEGWGPVKTKITVAKNQTNSFTYTLLSSAQLDSIAKIERRSRNARRWTRRVVFGLFTAAAWTGGIIINSKVSASLDKEDELLALYNAAPSAGGPISASEYDQRWDDYIRQTRGTDNLMLLRNIMYGVAGGFSFFLVLSIPF